MYRPIYVHYFRYCIPFVMHFAFIAARNGFLDVKCPEMSLNRQVVNKQNHPPCCRVINIHFHLSFESAVSLGFDISVLYRHLCLLCIIRHKITAPKFKFHSDRTGITMRKMSSSIDSFSWVALLFLPRLTNDILVLSPAIHAYIIMPVYP
jgi:hypothetical protein